MAIRVSRQEGEVLVSGGGGIRVGRQMIETLRESFFYEDVESDVNLSGVAHYNKDFAVSASSDLNLVSTASPTHEANGTGTLNFIQDVTHFLIQQDFIHVTSGMSLSQNLVYDAGLFQATFSNLALTQQVAYNYPVYIGIKHWLELLQIGLGARGCPWAPVEIEHDIDLSSVLNRTQDLSVNNSMNLSSGGWWSEPVEHDLNLSQLATAGRHGLIESVLALNSVMTARGIFVRSLTHSSVVGHALTYYLEGPCMDKQYIPFIGESTIANSPSPPDDELPIVQNPSSTERFKLIYPALAVEESSVVLRAPELDNLDRTAFNRISRETRGGKLSIFADPDWPKVQTIAATFIGLTKTEVDALSAFLVAYVGKQIRVQDWEGREWVGVVTMPNEACIQDGKRGWTTSFELEGTLIDDFRSSGDLNLAAAVGIEMDYARSLSHDLDFVSKTSFLLVP